MRQPEQVRDVWDALAAGFDEYTTPVTMAVADDVLDLVSIAPGTRFLDVGAGSGSLSIPAARLGAEVLAVDISPAMLERLEMRAKREGLTNIEGRVMDACALDLDADTFDVVASLNGSSILPQLQEALQELTRVTRPDGEVVVVNFASPEKAEWLGFFMGAMKAAVSGFEGPPPSPAFQLADTDKMRHELEHAGLTDVRIQPVIWEMEIQSGQHFWNIVRFANPKAAAMTGELTQEQEIAVQEALDGMLRERSGGAPAILETELNVGVGRA